jgi:hypothetical protein
MSEPIIVEQNRELEVMAESRGTSTANIARTVTRNDQPGEEVPEALFPRDEAGEFRRRWEQVQTEFVDDPRGSVEKADGLVADTIKRLAEVFADQRTRLEHEWDKGDSVSTEDFRQALRRYRSFFDRLLSAGGDSRPMR